MPALRNPRHELFAQALAQGKSAIDAHELAGYKRSRSTSSKMQRQDRIVARVQELLATRDKAERAATEIAIQKVSLTKEWVIQGLMENAQRALQRQAVLDDDGKPIGEYHYQGNVANRAFELLGRELGMFIERRETGVPGEFAAIENMSGPELLEFLAARLQPSSPDEQDETRH